MQNKNLIGLNMNIDEEIIKKTINDAIKVALVSAIGNPEEVIKKVVWAAMDKYVDRNGKERRKTDYDAIPYIEWLVGNVVNDAVRECIKELVEENREAFKASVKKYLMRGDFRDKMAEKYIEAVLGAAKSDLKMPIEINFKEIKR